MYLTLFDKTIQQYNTVIYLQTPINTIIIIGVKIIAFYKTVETLQIIIVYFQIFFNITNLFIGVEMVASLVNVTAEDEVTYR